MLKNHHESWYQTKLLKVIKKEIPAMLVLKLADHYSLGIPDICPTYNGMTSWWELKVHRSDRWPNLKDFGKGIQLHMAQRLALEGTCFYIIFIDTPRTKKTLIVHPDDVEIATPSMEKEGHDYLAVTEFIKDTHG